MHGGVNAITIALTSIDVRFGGRKRKTVRVEPRARAPTSREFDRSVQKKSVVTDRGFHDLVLAMGVVEVVDGDDEHALY